MTALTLIIDGNNLAYVLYQLPSGSKLTPDIDRRLIQHLGAYVADHGPDRVQVELCLDRGPGADLTPPGVRVWVARFPRVADDVLLARLDYHSAQGEPCRVVTHDGTVADEVAHRGQQIWPVWDFVRLPSWDNPRLASPPANVRAVQPPEHPAWPTSLALALERAQEQTAARPAPAARRRAAAVFTYTSTPRASPPPAGPDGGAAPSAAPADSPQSPRPAPDPQPRYRLAFENWPPAAGGKFLIESFCASHRQVYASLLAEFDPAHLQAHDLRTLADLLLEACGAEPDFLTRGSLMDRARLALLLAGGEPLTLAELAAQTGAPPAKLRRKLSRDVGTWVELVSPDRPGTA